MMASTGDLTGGSVMKYNSLDVFTSGSHHTPGELQYNPEEAEFHYSPEDADIAVNISLLEDALDEEYATKEADKEAEKEDGISICKLNRSFANSNFSSQLLSLYSYFFIMKRQTKYMNDILK